MGIVKIQGLQITQITTSVDLELKYILQTPMATKIDSNLDNLEFSF